ncbi:MarR family winged helix-turn-helix transcriptional regulator [Kitasatospora sp. NPDC051853]|uniref:MarR family winged helix-turn-helix transcriptional regulator n=1 Tax=Kitasatospora sp. NPDC051853 TaxID=3364058 RepID=UPI00379B71CD
MYDRRSGASNPSERTVRLLSRAGRAMDAMLAARLAARGLTPLHQSVLEALTELGPHGLPDLAEHLDSDEATLSPVVDELAAEGLVDVLVVHIGGRQRVVTVTEAGTAAATACGTDEQAVQDVLLASLTRGERAQLHYMLRQVCASAARGPARHPAS